MLSASLYITVCTTRNRLRVRLRRLREPRYLLGAIVGPAVLVLFPEIFRFVGGGLDIARIQEALYGLLLILVMLWRPQGLAGKRVA